MSNLLRKSLLPLALITTLAIASSKGDFVEPKGVYERVKSGQAILVDVRESDEISLGMAEPARWMPTSEIHEGSAKWKAFLESLPSGSAQKSKAIVLYCRSGRRAASVAAQLSDLGYRTENMGTYSAWEAAGLPTKKP